MKFLLSTILLASLALALPSPAPQEATTALQTDIPVIDDSLASYNFTPAFTSSFDDFFNLLDSIPDSILKSGDDALNQWFIDNGLRDPSASLLIDDTPDLVGDVDSVERSVLVARASAWKIAKCVASIVQLIATTAVPAAKLLKIKRYIKALGGVKMSVKLLLGSTTKAEKLKVGGKMLVYLSAELLGISSVKAACF